MTSQSTLPVYQDGAQFYSDLVEGCLWEAPFPVRDWDLNAAERARDLFLAHCNVEGLKVTFVV